MENNLLKIDINIVDERFDEQILPKISEAIFCAIKILNLTIDNASELSILLCNDEMQKQLNHKWRNIDKSTNVLSFAQIAPFSEIKGLIGDISLAYETIKKESEELNISFEDHFIHLIVHGFLHILGYNHENINDAKIMEDLEIKILKNLAIDNPYN